jgi:hypothetical protein
MTSLSRSASTSQVDQVSAAAPVSFTEDQARARFAERYPEFRNKIAHHFRDHTPEARDEAIANTFALLWAYIVGTLIPDGNATDPLMLSALYFCCRQTRVGRRGAHTRVGTGYHLLSGSVRDGVPSTINHLDLNHFVASRDSIPDIVSFRIDTPAWLASLTPRQRDRALEMAQGATTSELAERWRVSRAAVSLYRRQLNESYERFMACPE